MLTLGWSLFCYFILGVAVFHSNLQDEGEGYPRKVRSRAVHVAAKYLFPAHYLMFRWVEKKELGITSL